VKRDLEHIAIPGEHEARERAWQVAKAAFVEREGVERRPRIWRIALSVGVATVAVLAFVSPPGRAVLEDIRAVVGVERAEPALFSLPAKGRLLVASDAGIWVVQHDGSKRLLGPYREGSWSPFGRFVVVARENELAALEPDGNVRWTLARPNVSSPRWTGSDADTRIAYVDRTGIRVVAGDGTGDRLLVRAGSGPLAWRPGPRFVLAYSAPGRVRVVDATSGGMLWSARFPKGSATGIEWSADGRRLLVLSPHHLRLYDDRGHLVSQEDPSEGWPDVAAIFRPHTQEATVARLHGSQSSAYFLSGPTLFNGTGAFDGLAWSPDGRWLVVGWPTADQWVFVRAGGARRIQAVSNVSEQFRSRSLPSIEGWSK
jgi:hypothetical protein